MNYPEECSVIIKEGEVEKKIFDGLVASLEVSKAKLFEDTCGRGKRRVKVGVRPPTWSWETEGQGRGPPSHDTLFT